MYGIQLASMQRSGCYRSEAVSRKQMRNWLQVPLFIASDGWKLDSGVFAQTVVSAGRVWRDGGRPPRSGRVRCSCMDAYMTRAIFAPTPATIPRLDFISVMGNAARLLCHSMLVASCSVRYLSKIVGSEKGERRIYRRFPAPRFWTVPVL